MLKRAKLSHDKPEAVRRDLQIEIPLESAVELPLPGATRKMVNRIGATAHFHMTTPKIITDVADITESLKITHGEELLHYDSGSHDPERLFIFATPNLGVLRELWEMVLQRHLFYITRCFLSSIHNPQWSLAYKHLHISWGLRTTPEQETYSRLFKALNLNPSSVTIDFEIAVRKAFKQISTDVQISLCYFHFCHSLLRHVQNQGKNYGMGKPKIYIGNLWVWLLPLLSCRPKM